MTLLPIILIVIAIMKECFVKDLAVSFIPCCSSLSIICPGTCPGCWRPGLSPALKAVL